MCTEAAADFRKQAETLARYGVSPEDFRSVWQEISRARERDGVVRAQLYEHLKVHGPAAARQK